MDVHILILAAGSSTRMRGEDKLLQIVDGQPLLARVAMAALATGCPVHVALPPDRPLRGAALDGLPHSGSLSRSAVPDAALGLSASLKAGLSALPPTAPILLLLADLPEIDSHDLVRMLEEWRQRPDFILRGTSADGRPGHPVCLPAWCRPHLMRLSGDEGARQVIARHPDRVWPVALPKAHATTDLDTPEDWAAWRTARAGARTSPRSP